MIKKQLAISSILMIVFFSLISCTNNKETMSYENYLFDLIYGRKITTEYLRSIIDEDIDKANSLCLEELVAKNKELKSGVSKITSFQLYKSVEGSNYGYYIYDVIRANNDEPKTDLERCILKVIKNGDNYKISEIKSQVQKQLYIKGESLRIVGENGVDSNLVIDMSNIPNEAYLKENAIMIYKENVPKEEFGEIGIGFMGNKIAISTQNSKNSYICITIIDDSSMSGSGIEVSGDTSIGNSQEIIEKPIAKQLISLDLLNNSKINELIFSKNDQNLSVNYSINGVDRMNIYNTDSGSIVSLRLEETFPVESYNTVAKYFEGNSIVVNVSSTTSDSSKDGEYIIDLETLEIEKL